MPALHAEVITSGEQVASMPSQVAAMDPLTPPRGLSVGLSQEKVWSADSDIPFSKSVCILESIDM